MSIPIIILITSLLSMIVAVITMVYNEYKCYGKIEEESWLALTIAISLPSALLVDYLLSI